ncbi:hypothetical protein [Legionella erythra]|uniref:Uncharacterized protein n=1 Tax=Legionella erythra TaxID=448 RepID=A0A0W0TUS2_LEGER|nr:hypothetical protein [Legionella erythra]KTC99442.1 hypothetical protein Lery_0343 [Legionella erythra]
MRKAPALLLILTGLVPLMVYAADLPTVVIGSENYDHDMCVQQYTDNCISTVCITSSALDCNEQCKAAAIDKCEEKEEE